jgi:SAM-dependent methyltransferase
MCSHLPAQPVSFDSDRSAAFADKLLATLNHGALTLMLSLGHRGGLFDTMSKMPPATSQEIADAANLNERYVREWLGAMTVADVVECDPQGPRYSLPEEHAALLTRDAGSDNFAVFTQYIPLLGSVEDDILDCFRNGGGVPYSKFGRFQEVMVEDSGMSVLPALIDQILPLADGLVDRLKAGITVLDIGCGRGRALNLMAETFPNSRFVGYDFLEDAVDFASTDSARLGLTNIEFQTQDVAKMTDVERFDLITAFDAIHDQARPDVVLANVHRALKADGVFLAQDIAGSSHHHKNHDHPLGTLLYTVSCMHCMTVSLAYDGMGLGTMWGEEKARQMFDEAGLHLVSQTNLPHDVQNTYYVLRRK